MSNVSHPSPKETTKPKTNSRQNRNSQKTEKKDTSLQKQQVPNLKTEPQAAVEAADEEILETVFETAKELHTSRRKIPDSKPEPTLRLVIPETEGELLDNEFADFQNEIVADFKYSHLNGSVMSPSKGSAIDSEHSQHGLNLPTDEDLHRLGLRGNGLADLSVPELDERALRKRGFSARVSTFLSNKMFGMSGLSGIRGFNMSMPSMNISDSSSKLKELNTKAESIRNKLKDIERMASPKGRDRYDSKTKPTDLPSRPVHEEKKQASERKWTQEQSTASNLAYKERISQLEKKVAEYESEKTVERLESELKSLLQEELGVEQPPSHWKVQISVIRR